MYNRIVTLVDMDCFYCQVEARINSNLQGKPMAVVQYNDWKGGGIIAVNYEARDRGVTRYMRGDEAKKICPEIELVRVATVRGKADLTKYRDASREVFNVICEFSECVQRASIDEAYIDLTEAVDKRLQMGECITSKDLQNTFIVGYGSKNNNNEDERAKGVADWLREVYDEDVNDTTDLKRLALGAVIVEEMRAAIFNKTTFKCSAGIAHNKIMAKLVAGLHKPNRQTLLPATSVTEFFRDLPVQKVRNLGGKFGNDVIEKLGCKFMADLSNYSEKDLQSFFDEKTGTWLYNIARGIDLEPVTARLVSKSIGCCKQFRGIAALKTKKDVIHWIGELAHEIAERLDEDAHMNKRKAQLLTVSIQQEIGKKKTASSRSVSLVSYDTEAIAGVALSAIKRMNSAPQSSDLWTPPLLFLGISAGKFKDDSSTSNKMINQYFQNNSNQSTSSSNCNYSANAKHENELEEGRVSENQSCEKFKENKTESNESEVIIRSDKENNNKNVSFFQRYFNNNRLALDKSNKSEPIASVEKKSAISVPSTSSSDSDGNLHDKINSVENCSKTVGSNNNSCLNGKFHTDDSSTSLYFKNHDVVDVCIKSDDNDLSISPSEIFPDLNNIDKEVLSMLPLKLQNKILSRISKNQAEKESTSESIVDENINYNNCSETKLNSVANRENDVEDSPSVPATRVITTAHVHSFKDESNGCKDRVNTETCSSIKQIEFKDKSDHNSQLSDHNAIDKIEDCENCEPVKFSQEIAFDAPSMSKSEEGNKERLSTLDEINNEMNCASLCPNCNEKILQIDLQEHLDHHVALELDKQLNSDNQQNQSTDNSRSSNLRKNKTPTKRKRGPYNKKGLGIEGKKPRSILSFFIRK